MIGQPQRPTSSGSPGASALVPWFIGMAGLGLVTVGTLPYAGSWNDGSRLAAVESIVDRHTLAIDDSIFCRPPADTLARGCPPYPSQDENLLTHGTRDKLLIAGHFYSDKPAVISILLAGLYQVERWVGLPRAAERPDLFCWTLTFGTAGLSYLLAVFALYRLGGIVGLPPRLRLAWIASFALATFALTYSRQVNNHIMLLGVTAIICLQAVGLARESPGGQVTLGRLVALGTLAGLGFNLDLGSGPLLLGGLLGLVVYRSRRLKAGAVFLLAAFPWVACGLGINYVIGGVWKPMNMVPEYSAWLGCPFNPSNMTGFSRHGPVTLPVYALALLFGKKGLLVHNLPLLLALPALAALVRRPSPHRPELTFAVGWCAATWLLYAVLSNNSGGACCSIRWFVPFLAPGYYLLAVYLCQYQQYRPDFLVLSLWGTVLGALMWWKGPWTLRMTPLLWPIVGAALVSWLVCRYYYRRQEIPAGTVFVEAGRPSVAA